MTDMADPGEKEFNKALEELKHEPKEAEFDLSEAEKKIAEKEPEKSVDELLKEAKKTPPAGPPPETETNPDTGPVWKVVKRPKEE